MFPSPDEVEAETLEEGSTPRYKGTVGTVSPTIPTVPLYQGGTTLRNSSGSDDPPFGESPPEYRENPTPSANSDVSAYLEAAEDAYSAVDDDDWRERFL